MVVRVSYSYDDWRHTACEYFDDAIEAATTIEALIADDAQFADGPAFVYRIEQFTFQAEVSLDTLSGVR